MVRIYVEEGAKANGAGVKKAFHEKAVMNGHGADGYVSAPISNLFI